MKNDKAVDYIDHREPLLVEWAVDKYGTLRDVSADQAEKFGEAVFSDAFIRAVLDGRDTTLAVRMMSIVPAEMFSEFIDEIAEGWKQHRYDLIPDTIIFKVIAGNSPSKAMGLLTESFAQLPLAGKISLAPCGDFLLPEDAATFSHSIINEYLAAGGELPERDRDAAGLLVAKLAVKYAHPDAVSLVGRFISDSLQKKDIDILVFLYNFVSLFGMDDFEFDLFCSLCEKEIEKLPGELNRFYKMENGAEVFNRLAVDAMGEGISDFKGVVQAHLDAVGDDAVKDVLTMLVTDEGIASAFEKKEIGRYLQGAVLSVLWYYNRVESLDALELTEQEAVALLLLEVENHPFMKGLQAFYAGIAGERAGALLLDRFEKAGSGLAAVNVLKVMEHLKNPAFIPVLVGNFKQFDTEMSGALMEKSAGVLSFLGNPVVEALENEFESLDPACHLYLLTILERVGTPEAEAFLVKHLDTFMRMLKSDVLHTCTMLLSEEAVKHLEGKIGKEQFFIDKLFVTVSLLTGNRNDRVEAVLKSCNRQHALFAEKLGSILNHDLEQSGSPYLTLEMECEQCGDINDYKAFTVYHSSSQAPYVADEFICLNCHDVCDFKLTQKGMGAVFAETARLVSLSEKGGNQQELLEKSPLKFIRIAISGREMGVDEGIALYKSQIAASPDDPENYIGIGNVYKFCNRNIFAERSYLKAIELGPEYIEPYFSMAQLFVTKENDDISLEWLEKGRKYLKKPVVCKARQISVEKVLESYIALYNSLVHKTKSNLKPIDIKAYREGILRSKKTGRNDPCPCGSGKKYKKCCMGK